MPVVMTATKQPSKSVPVLQFAPGSHGSRNERQINRRALVDVMPDREDLLCGPSSTEEVRRAVRLRFTSPKSHWLYKRKFLRKFERVPKSDRSSLFLDEGFGIQGDTTSSSVCDGRSQLSSPSSSATMVVDDRFSHGARGYSIVDVWDDFVSEHAPPLVSPRSLDCPTHILSLRGRVDGFEDSPSIIEIPINDGLFALNAPNLILRPIGGGDGLPSRMKQELPRAIVLCPSLDTFPEMTVYLHNKNQAELLRSLVPEWIRDIVYPLQNHPPGVTRVHEIGHTRQFLSKKHSHRQLFGLRGGLHAISSDNHKGDGPAESDSVKADFESISSEVADCFETLEGSRKRLSEEGSLFRTSKRLLCLKENLEFVGYFEDTLWSELDVYTHITTRAISIFSRRDGKEM